VEKDFDAIVVGAGQNGLAAAITVARAGLSVLVLEANDFIGGGTHSREATLPGFVHDICSAIHPLTLGSPFFRENPLEKYGLEFVNPPASLAHALDERTAVLLKQSIEETADNFDREDAASYRNLMRPLVADWDALAPEILAPIHIPRKPFLLAGFGLKSFRSARGFADKYFKGARARALHAGCAAHAMIPLEDLPTAAAGLVLQILAHRVGWVFPRGGAQKITDAMTAQLRALGGEIRTNHRVENLDELPASAKAVFLNLTPRQILKIAGRRLPENYKRRLEKYKYGAGAFKIDWALSEPIPWRAQECFEAGTVHLGGTFEDVAETERIVHAGGHPEKPFVLVAQNSLFDPTRAPAGKQVGWAYCHVPNNSDFSMTERIEDQIERYAPGFRDCILARSVIAPSDLERHNANMIGGDINGGAAVLSQFFTRPVASLNPYRTPLGNVYICSSSTPPGGGVHGMCGYHAARTALADLKIPVKSSVE
jgi:phytoene dehydrogenase-like protein